MMRKKCLIRLFNHKNFSPAQITFYCFIKIENTGTNKKSPKRKGQMNIIKKLKENIHFRFFLASLN